MRHFLGAVDARKFFERPWRSGCYSDIDPFAAGSFLEWIMSGQVRRGQGAEGDDFLSRQGSRRVLDEVRATAAELRMLAESLGDKGGAWLEYFWPLLTFRFARDPD